MRQDGPRPVRSGLGSQDRRRFAYVDDAVPAAARTECLREGLELGRRTLRAGNAAGVGRPERDHLAKRPCSAVRRCDHPPPREAMR